MPPHRQLVRLESPHALTVTNVTGLPKPCSCHKAFPDSRPFLSISGTSISYLVSSAFLTSSLSSLLAADTTSYFPEKNRSNQKRISARSHEHINPHTCICAQILHPRSVAVDEPSVLPAKASYSYEL